MKILLLLIGGLAAIIGISVVSAIWSGYVLSILWGWFVVPAMSLPPISIPLAIGISLIAHMLTRQDLSQLAQKESTSSVGARISTSWATTLAIPAFGLLIGWIVKGYL